MIMPPSSSMFTCVTLPSSSAHRPVSVKPNACAIQSAARPTSSYENIGTTRCSDTFAQLLRRLVEHGGVQIHIRLCRLWGHQRHVVERGQQNATVERIEMNQTVELGVATGRGLAPAPRAFGSEEILDAAPEAGDMPGQAVPFDRVCHPRFKALAQLDHVLESRIGQHP